MIYLVEGVDAMEILPLYDIALMRALIFVTLLNHRTTQVTPSMNTFRNPIMREFSAKAQGLNGLLNMIAYAYNYLVYHLTSI